MSNPEEVNEVDILLFEVGSTVFGADASQVVRVDSAGAHSLSLAELGPLKTGHRALVFRGEEGEGRLRIDAVRGVKTVRVNELRRLPKAAAMKSYALGIWLDGEQTVLLIDLQEAAKSGRPLKD